MRRARRMRPSVKWFFGEVAGKFCDGAYEKNGLVLAIECALISGETLLGHPLSRPLTLGQRLTSGACSRSRRLRPMSGNYL